VRVTALAERVAAVGADLLAQLVSGALPALLGLVEVVEGAAVLAEASGDVDVVD
jgi:hypothetical protein